MNRPYDSSGRQFPPPGNCRTRPGSSQESGFGLQRAVSSRRRRSESGVRRISPQPGCCLRRSRGSRRSNWRPLASRGMCRSDCRRNSATIGRWRRSEPSRRRTLSRRRWISSRRSGHRATGCRKAIVARRPRSIGRPKGRPSLDGLATAATATAPDQPNATCSASKPIQRAR